MTLNATLSANIRVTRVLCILALVYVHVPPWFPQVPKANPVFTSFDYYFVFLHEAVSRTSVPLLSIISGYLLASSEKSVGHIDRIRKKIPSLLVPLLAWNLISVVIGLAIGRFGPATALEWVNRFAAVTNVPAITPLYFLRDIFLCVVLFPLIRFAVKHLPWPTVGLMALASVTGATTLIYLNSFILLFFTVGCGVALGVIRRPAIGVVPLFIASIIIAVIATVINLRITAGGFPKGMPTDFALGLLGLLQRGVGAMLFWQMAKYLTTKPIGDVFQKIEPHIFFFFCSHTLILAVMWQIATRVGWDYGTMQYAIFYSISPLLTLVPALIATSILLITVPAVLKILCGGRLPKPLFDGRSVIARTSA